MKEHYDNEGDARAVTDRYLDEWMVLIGLRIQPGEIDFRFNKAEIIDLEPQQDDNIHHLTAKSITTGQPIIGSPTLHVSRNKYPTPPSCFKINPNVETMYNRYRAYREGRDNLLSMAYLVLTVLEMNQGRARAANQYGISKKVLDRLGTLCSHGDHNDARKAPKSGKFRPLNGQAKAWIEAAIRLIIERVGLIEGGTQGLEQITMINLPPLIDQKTDIQE